MRIDMQSSFDASDCNERCCESAGDHKRVGTIKRDAEVIKQKTQIDENRKSANLRLSISPCHQAHQIMTND
jgi:hypothetical protein